MGFIAKLTEFFLERNIPTVKGSGEFGWNISAAHCSPPGDDSPPLVSDYAAFVEAGGTGTYNSVGYVDRKNFSEAQPGEKRLYARETDGTIVATVWLVNDGAIRVYNDNGIFELQPNGDVYINGLTIDSDGNLTTPGKIIATEIEAMDSLVVAGNELAGHDHNYQLPTTSSGIAPTGPNNP